MDKVKEIDVILSILRNTYGISDDMVREARRNAADKIEELLSLLAEKDKEIEGLLNNVKRAERDRLEVCDLLRERDREIERWKNDWQKLNKHIEEKLNLLMEKEKKIGKLEKENIQFAKWVQINASETGEQKVRAEKAEARIKELEKQLNQEMISINELSLANQYLGPKVDELEVKIANLEHDKELIAYGVGLDLMDKESLRARIKSLKEGIEEFLEDTYGENWKNEIDNFYPVDIKLYNLIKGG